LFFEFYVLFTLTSILSLKGRGGKLWSLFPRPLGQGEETTNTDKLSASFLLVQPVDVAALIQFPDKSQIGKILGLCRLPLGFRGQNGF